MPDRWVNPRHPNRGPWWRRWYVVLAAVLVLLGAVALGDEDETGLTAGRSAAAPTTSNPLPTVTTTPPTTSTTPPTTSTTIPTVEVPDLVGMGLATAKGTLADLGLRGTVRYRTTARHRAGTVIAQSRRTGSGVRPDSRITLVVAKAPPPPPTTAPPPPTTAPQPDCDPSYPGVCLDPDAADYDCAGGSGDGPEYVEGPIRVRPPDPFDLDREGDGWGCESG
jgi:hypothetical protein